MLILILAALHGILADPGASAPISLRPGSEVALQLGPTETRDAVLEMRAGESVDLAVLQQGIDVVVEAYGPNGALLESVDSPNGRHGDEALSLFAEERGVYRLRIRPLSPDEPSGRVTVRIAAFRDASETLRLLAESARARAEAAGWLRPRSAPIPLSGLLSTADPLPPFDDLAASARIIGLGEATHGSREFGDLRLSLVRRLVERHGYRLIAIEDSASRWRAVEAYLGGDAATPGGVPLEWGWIGRRPRRELLEWARQWNLDHPKDRIRIVGVDPQDNRPGIEQLGRFLEQAYGPDVGTEWRVQAEELVAADEQTDIFGYSGVGGTLRQFLQHIAFQLAADGPLLRTRFGDRIYEQAMEAARDVAAFADFNSRDGTISHSRDWYMALGILRAIEEGSSPKTIFWAHNAHVSVASDQRNTTGAMLKRVFGCGYGGVATTFGQGAFIALVPQDPENRLAATTLPAASDESLERVLADVRPGAHLSAWPCRKDPDRVPEWLRAERPLRSVGGLWSPDAPASISYAPAGVTAAFDAIAYFPRVTAEDIPVKRPIIPLRQKVAQILPGN